MLLLLFAARENKVPASISDLRYHLLFAVTEPAPGSRKLLFSMNRDKDVQTSLEGETSTHDIPQSSNLGRWDYQRAFREMRPCLSRLFAGYRVNGCRPSGV